MLEVKFSNIISYNTDVMYIICSIITSGNLFKEI